jgi:hypothetical protein
MTIERAVVVQQDPDNYAVYVSIQGKYGGAGPLLPCTVGTQGPRDATTGHYPMLPTPGTPGLIALTSGDVRNGVWLCSTRTQLTDASSHAPGLGGMAFSAHFDGGFSARMPDGSTNEVWPDGSVLQIGPTMLAPTRHTLDGSQARQRTPYTASERCPAPPGAFPVALHHPSGASATLSASGAWSLATAAGQPMTLTGTSGAVAAVSAAGAWSITAAAGQPVTVSVPGGASITIDAAGNVAITTPGQLTVTAAAAMNVHAPSVGISNGGSVQALKRADGSNTTVLFAQ